MKRRYTTMLSSSLVLAMAVAIPAAANRPQDAKDQTHDDPITFTCDNDDTDMAGDADDVIVFHGDLVMWPPNHKTQNVYIEAIDGGDDDATTTLTTTATHDEYVGDFVPDDDTSEEEQIANEEQGSGHTANDASPFGASDPNEDGDNTATTAHDLRSERSGRGDGRTYTITATAMFDGDSCSTQFAVNVPHDMRSSNADPKEDKTGDS